MMTSPDNEIKQSQAHIIQVKPDGYKFESSLKKLENLVKQGHNNLTEQLMIAECKLQPLREPCVVCTELEPPTQLHLGNEHNEKSESPDMLVCESVERIRIEEKTRKWEIRALEKKIEEQRRKRISKGAMITPEGGKIELLGCQVEFQSGSLEKNTEITISVINHPDSLPSDQLSITPVLDCKPSMEFNKPVIITMTSWCLPECGKTIDAMVMHKKKRMAEWETLVPVQVSDRGKLQFEVGHFCGHVAVKSNESDDWSWFIRSGGCAISIDVYVSTDHGLIIFMFQTDQADILSDLGDRYKRVIPVAKKIMLQMGDKIVPKIKCREPKNTDVSPFRENEASFILDDYFLSVGETQLYFEMKPEPPSDLEKVRMDCTIEHLDKDGHWVTEYGIPLRTNLKKRTIASLTGPICIHANIATQAGGSIKAEIHQSPSHVSLQKNEPEEDRVKDKATATSIGPNYITTHSVAQNDASLKAEYHQSSSLASSQKYDDAVKDLKQLTDK